MDERIMKQVRFVLEDDNELMAVASGPRSDLDEENKRMDRELIKRHEKILDKVDRGKRLMKGDFELIRDANEIHLNDEDNVAGHYKEAVALNEWLEQRIELSKEEAMKVLEEHLDRDSHTAAKVYRALHSLWERATGDDVLEEPVFDMKGMCLKCGRKMAFADVTDTIMFVGDEIVKRYDGDITNRNCVRCNCPEQYADYEEHDEPGC
ncbi:hypothetical protein ACFL5F_03295 [Planctomycetota bacterium]